MPNYDELLALHRAEQIKQDSFLRIQGGSRYFNYTINEFQLARFTNSGGDFFDDNIMNNTHIPILDSYK